MAERKALVVGVTGTTGYTAARHLLAEGWEVHGISRRSVEGLDGVVPIHVDVTDPDAVAEALEGADFSHVFFCIWIRQETEDENRRVNSGIVRNVLDALSPTRAAKHVALVTGLKHYLGPFEAYAEAPADTPFREDQDRLEVPTSTTTRRTSCSPPPNSDGFAWSVHRAHTVIGWAPTNSMNMGATLGAYGSICRELDRPFVFPGSPVQYEGVTDVTDARVLAEQLGLVGDRSRRRGPGAEHRQRRRLPLEADVAGGRRGSRRRAGALPRRADAAGRADGGDGGGLGAIVAKHDLIRCRSQARHLVAHRRRPRPADRDLRRHDQVARARLSGVPPHRRDVPRHLRPPAVGADHPTGRLSGSAALSARPANSRRGDRCR